MTTSKPTEARELNNPFDFFETPWFKDGTNQLCADGWPMFVVPLNIKIRECKESYEQAQKEISFLKQIIQRQNTELETFHGMTFSENQEILKLREQVDDYEQALEFVDKYETDNQGFSATSMELHTVRNRAREALKKWDTKLITKEVKK